MIIFLIIRKRLFKPCLWGISSYRSETMIIGIPEKKNIEAFEMWRNRTMLKIRRLDVDRIRNEEVLKEEERKLWIFPVCRRETNRKQPNLSRTVERVNERGKL